MNVKKIRKIEKTTLKKPSKKNKKKGIEIKLDTIVSNKNSIKKIKGKKLILPDKEIRFSNLEDTMILDVINLNKPKKKKKILFPITAILTIILTFTVLYFAIPKKDNIKIKLYGLEEITLDVYKSYKESGLKLLINDKDMSSSIKIKGKVNTKKVGIYELKYYFEDKLLKTRKIKIVDNEAPNITINGEEQIVLLETAEYKEQGALVEDNYDKNIQLIIEGEVDTKKVGEYKITYKAKDKSGNESSKQRIVIVEEKPKEIIKTVAKQEVDKPPVINQTPISGQIKNITYIQNGIKIEGCAESSEIPTGIALGSNFYQVTTNGSCYTANIDLANIPNGTYTAELMLGEIKKPLINKLDQAAQLARSRIGNKLITFTYPNNNVSIQVQNFYYEYDVIIDVGHGGYDSGAVNNYITEKQMNLIVSLYEKELYEKAGFKVLLTRTQDNYGSGMGPGNWPDLRKRSYYMGYYGTTAKVMYSNHHNASLNSNAKGFQMYVSTKMTNMQTELNIYNQVNQIFRTSGIYTRDYWTGNLYSKAGGQYYDLTNYYAVLRLPADLFNNHHVTIYEGSFLSNPDDHIEYWLNEKWKKVSEIKVKNYISKMQGM